MNAVLRGRPAPLPARDPPTPVRRAQSLRASSRGAGGARTREEDLPSFCSYLDLAVLPSFWSYMDLAVLGSMSGQGLESKEEAEDDSFEGFLDKLGETPRMSGMTTSSMGPSPSFLPPISARLGSSAKSRMENSPTDAKRAS